MRFELGEVVITRGCLASCEKHGVNALTLVRRHHKRDWGDLSFADKQANTVALVHGHRLVSAYETAAGKVYIITEADRSLTTIMLASEY